MKSAIFHLGLTGGIGSGKSTVAGMLAQRGAAVIDADAISRATTAAHGPAIPLIAEAFGAHMIAADGALDRAAMRQLVFEDASARQRLEAIVHPLINRETERQTQDAIGMGVGLLVFDVPLLVESGAKWRSRLDRVLVIDCPPDVQTQRVMGRSGLSPEETKRIMEAQASRHQRLAAADIVIYNGHGVTLESLETDVSSFWQTLPEGIRR